MGQKAQAMKSAMFKLFESKIDHFESVFPYPLVNVDRIVRLNSPFRHWKTYSPDFHCEALGSYIECCSSYGNLTSYAEKWANCINKGFPLRVYWWRGQEITDFLRGEVASAAYILASLGEHYRRDAYREVFTPVCERPVVPTYTNLKSAVAWLKGNVHEDNCRYSAILLAHVQNFLRIEGMFTALGNHHQGKRWDETALAALRPGKKPRICPSEFELVAARLREADAKRYETKSA